MGDQKKDVDRRLTQSLLASSGLFKPFTLPPYMLNPNYGVTCSMCGQWFAYSHECPAYRDLSPMGGGPNPWKDHAR